MKAYLSRRYHLSASHRLHTDELDEAQNRNTFGKCNNPYGHGHNYTIQVTFSGQVDSVTGMVTDLDLLDAFAQERLLGRYDLQNLNKLPEFAAVVSTSENFSIEVHRIFSEFPHAQLESVHVEETSKNSFDFAGVQLPPAGRY
jgi:6-pyruvoyltetrahydropterin/6-carboxytetrahydropterin synthase